MDFITFPTWTKKLQSKVRFGIRTNAAGKGLEGEGVCNSVLDQRIPNPMEKMGVEMMEGSGGP